MGSGAPGRVRDVLRNSALLAVAKLLERATGFVVALLVAAYLGVDGLGVYAAAWAVYVLMAMAGEAGTTNYLVRELSRDPTRTASYTIHLSTFALGFAIVLMIGGEIVVPRLGYSTELETGVSVVLLATLPRVLNSIQEAVFVAHGKVEFQTLTRLPASIGYVLAAAWLLREGHDATALLRTLVAIEYVVAGVYFIAISRFIARLRLEFHWSVAARLARDIKPFAAQSALSALFARPEVLLLSVLASERELGLYSAAIRVAEPLLLVPEVFMMNILPVLSKAFVAAEERYVAWQTAAVRAMLAFSLPIAAYLIAEADAIVALLFGSEFSAAAPLLRIIAITLVCHSLIAVFFRSLIARGRQTTDLAILSVMVGLRLGGGALAIAALAATGAAIVNAGISTLYVALLARATTRSGAPSRLFSVGWRFVVAAVSSGVGVWLLGNWVPFPMTLGVATVVFAGTALAVGAITPEDRLLLRRVSAARARAGAG